MTGLRQRVRLDDLTTLDLFDDPRMSPRRLSGSRRPDRDLPAATAPDSTLRPAITLTPSR